MTQRRPRLVATSGAIGWAVLMATLVAWSYDRYDVPYPVPWSVGLAVVPSLPVSGYVVARPTTANLAFRGIGVAVGLLCLLWAIATMRTASCQVDAFCGTSVVLPAMADVGAFLACRAGRGLVEQRRRHR
ncbi:MAG TPA: hypothetical protein VHF47_05315 [Acidimicrobiales bacterium]|nr:hypothetical protein [Acidimicrobiales bacterium]